MRTLFSSSPTRIAMKGGEEIYLFDFAHLWRAWYMKELTLREIQKRIWDNKVKKGFNTTDISKEFLYLTEELGEAVKAYRKDNKDELAEEIADLIIYSLGLFIMLDKDGYEEIIKKMEKNESREYQGEKGAFKQLRKDPK